MEKNILIIKSRISIELRYYNIFERLKMPEMTSEQWKDLEKHFQQGESLHSLEKRYPVSRVAIRKHLRKQGYETAKKKEINKPLTEGFSSLSPTESPQYCQVPMDIFLKVLRKLHGLHVVDLERELYDCMVPCAKKWELKRELEGGIKNDSDQLILPQV